MVCSCRAVLGSIQGAETSRWSENVARVQACQQSPASDTGFDGNFQNATRMISEIACAGYGDINTPVPPVPVSVRFQGGGRIWMGGR